MSPSSKVGNSLVNVPILFSQYCRFGGHIQVAAAVLGALFLAGCTGGNGKSKQVERVWGRHGLANGRFHKPRAMTIDENDEIYIVDMTGRVQVFNAEGKFLRVWRTPDIRKGKPTGLSIDREGNVMVADTHYHRVLFYSKDGTLLEDKTIGGVAGQGPGEFGFVTDAVQDSQGNFYVGEYGDFDRIQKFSPSGEYLLQWGGHGSSPGQFIRPQGLVVDKQDRIWVADACNHRIQVFEVDGQDVNPVKIWGEYGTQPGQLSYPYGLILDGEGHVYVAEFGNHRVQKFTTEGKSLAVWGTGGRRTGELNRPWALVRDSRGRIHVLDTQNHRVQTIRL